MSLSERIRPDCEAAPWVCEEVKQLESRLKQLEVELATAQAFHCLAVKERDYEREHVTTLRSVIAAELEAKRLLIADKALADRGTVYLEVTAAAQDAGGNPLADEVAERLLREPSETLLAKIEQQRQRIVYLEGATNHATGTPLSVTTKALQDAVRIMNGDRTQPLARILEARAVCVEALKRLHK